MPKSQPSPLPDAAALSAILGMTPTDLYASVYSKKYKNFLIPKKSGGGRLINAPKGRLLVIQKRLANFLAGEYGTRSSVHGFIRKRGIVTNARAHIGAKIVFNCDLADFFPSIHFGRVRGLLMAAPYNYTKEVAQLIARICCHNGVLPQGAPTSPIVSNMICGQLDSKLKHLARQHKCFYTRYADDLTFSSTASLPKAIVERDGTGAFAPGSVLLAILANSGFALNPLKTRLAGDGSRKEVTGVIVGAKNLNVRRSQIRRLRCMLHAWQNFGLELATEEFLQTYDVKKRQDVDFISVVRGRLEHLGHVKGRDNEVYFRLMERFLKLDPKANCKPIISTSLANDDTLKRSVYVLQATDSDGIEIHSTAFWLENVGLVTANHAVRDLHGTMYTKLKIFKTTASIDGIPVKAIKGSSNYDLAILECLKPPKPTIQLGRAPIPTAGSPLKVLGYPHFNAGSPASLISGQLIRSYAFSAVTNLVVSPVINQGNSGGPVLDQNNRVIGVCVKGANLGENIATAINHIDNLPAI